MPALWVNASKSWSKTSGLLLWFTQSGTWKGTVWESQLSLTPRPAESVSHPEEASPEEQPEETGAEASAEEEQPREEEEEEAEAAEYLAELPEPLLLRVLVELPATELVQVCRLVCQRWKELVDSAPLWLLKCQQEGLVPEGSADDERDHWQQFYFLSKRRRNLLRNPCGEGEGRIVECPLSLLENGPWCQPASRLNEMKRLVQCLAQNIPLLPGESPPRASTLSELGRDRSCGH